MFIENQNQIILNDIDECIDHYSTLSDWIWYENTYQVPLSFKKNLHKIILKDTDKVIDHYLSLSYRIWYDNKQIKCHCL